MSNLKRSAVLASRSKSSEPKPKQAKRLCSFRKEYSIQWPCLSVVQLNSQLVHCSVCKCDFSIGHDGKADCERHVNGPKHVDIARSISKTPISNFFNKPNSTLDDAVTTAEVLFTGFLVEHNIALAASDHVSKLFKAMFIQPGVSSADIINKYACARTKTTSIVKAMAAGEAKSLIDAMKASPFSIATDASNDRNEKLFPIVVRMFKDGEIRTELLSVLECAGKSTGENISAMILNDFRDKGIDFKNCMALTTDNANVMVGSKNGLYGKLLATNPRLFATGCVCHRLHLAAEWANKELPMNVNDFFVDIYYYIEKSANRRKTLKDFQQECETPTTEVPKHCTTRWLSLGATCKWVLTQWEPLLKFFKGECGEEREEAGPIGTTEGGGSRKENVLKNLESRTMKMCVLYLAYVIPVFDRTNQLFQQEAPLIHRQHRLLTGLIRGLMLMFVKPSGLTRKLVTDVDFSSVYNIMDGKNLMIGSSLREYMEAENISADKRRLFYKNVVKFLSTGCKYLLKNLPLDEPVIKNAAVADILWRKDANFSSLRFLLNQFPLLLTMDEVEEEFRNYLSCDLPNIPDFEKLSMDQQWIEMNKLKNYSGSPLLKHLPSIMLKIISIPHRNASSERMFSLVRVNRTDFRNSMSVDTLQSLLILKQNTQECFKRNPSSSVLKACKSATTMALSKQ